MRPCDLISAALPGAKYISGITDNNGDNWYCVNTSHIVWKNNSVFANSFSVKDLNRIRQDVFLGIKANGGTPDTHRPLLHPSPLVLELPADWLVVPWDWHTGWDWTGPRLHLLRHRKHICTLITRFYKHRLTFKVDDNSNILNTFRI